ncbi:hypothetical protein P885DRAFT_33180 [Corynascus similis CBS 632.67]
MAGRSSNRSAGSQEPVEPTEETQELYNKWKQLEEQMLTVESLSQVQDDGTGFLCPPSPSQVTTSSRARSHASTTHSITQGLGEVNMGDQQRVGKRKRGRHGPLTKVGRAKAALMRKVGACESCRERGVACNHANFVLFEEPYRRWKQAQSANQAVHAPQLSQDAPYERRQGDEIALLGMGARHIQVPNPSLYFPAFDQTGNEDVNPDFDPLQNNHPSTSRVPATIEPAMTAVHDTSTFVSNNYNPLYMGFTRQTNAEAMLIGIRAARSREWVCKWNDICNLCFPDEHSLTSHFTVDHAQVSRHWSTWRCFKCQLDVEERAPDGLCPQCTDKEPDFWGRCCWGSLNVAEDYRSIITGLAVSSQGHTSSNHSSWMSRSSQYSANFEGRYGHTSMPSSGSYGRCSYNGGSQSYTASSEASPTTDIRPSSTCCAKPPLPILADFWTLPKSSYSKDCGCDGSETKKGPSQPPYTLRQVCPAAVVLGVLVLATFDHWASPVAAASGKRFFGGRVLERALSGVRCGLVVDRGCCDAVVPSQLSVACIAAGMLAGWVFWHARERLRVRRWDVSDGANLDEGVGGFEAQVRQDV